MHRTQPEDFSGDANMFEIEKSINNLKLKTKFLISPASLKISRDRYIINKKLRDFFQMDTTKKEIQNICLKDNKKIIKISNPDTILIKRDFTQEVDFIL